MLFEGVTHEPGVQPVIKFLLWLLLAVISLPLALLALILYPIIWLVSLPFQLVGVSLKAVFEFIGALIKLPARVLQGPQSN